MKRSKYFRSILWTSLKYTRQVRKFRKFHGKFGAFKTKYSTLCYNYHTNIWKLFITEKGAIIFKFRMVPQWRSILKLYDGNTKKYECYRFDLLQKKKPFSLLTSTTLHWLCTFRTLFFQNNTTIEKDVCMEANF